ncbi:MAG: DNA-binding transcriptional regulator Fis [Luminiphilus sp.]|nr:DNA-binding transcriptional regulator Fis [Halieaceae bacterium]PDH39289.1 MAG: DNA-binding transcriptional regulator Fis [Halieaceae bacterium MED-G26]RPG88831.1 MAG: DNA-binding transcriptional regulator Fis [Cellvibrionales bacterium TMED157]
MTSQTKGTLKSAAEDAIRQFIETLDGEEAREFYNLVLAEVEEPLLRVVMEYTANNQSRAAAMLGLNRGTLRKKLRQYDLL